MKLSMSTHGEGYKKINLSGKRILFFVPEGDFPQNGIYVTQVGGLATFCEKEGALVKIWSNMIRGHHWFFQTVKYVRRLIDENKEELKKFRPTHIYVRTAPMAIAAKKLAEETGAKLVYSMRGADVAETMLKINFRSIVLAINVALQVRKAVEIADHINSVSYTMQRWIRKTFNKDSSVLPCCVPDYGMVDMKDIKPHKGKTVVYCGGICAWQNIDAIIKIMQKIRGLDKNIQFCFLTKDIDLLEKKCFELGFPKECWTAKTCKQIDIPSELNKADVGIILRSDILVNQVASPIKIGEYLSSGLCLITSVCIGDVASSFINKEFAYLVDGDIDAKKLVDFINQVSIKTRMQALEWAQKHFTYEGNKKAVYEMFS